jgi:uncharacterized spore protein YtfJ
MNVPEMLKSIGEQVQSSASAKNVYGEPVSVADRTVIPVARVRYGFGGGGGGPQGEAQNSGPGGGCGGGHVSALPLGVIEITPASTRFIPIPDWRKTFALVALCLGFGFISGSLRRR